MPSAWGNGGSIGSCESLLERIERNDPTLIDLVVLPVKSFGPKELSRIAGSIANGSNTHLSSVSASGHALPAASLRELGNALTAQARRILDENALEEEDLSGADVGGAGVLVGTGGGRKGGVKSLAVGDKDTGNEGIAAFCDGLAASRGGLVEALDFGWKNVSEDGMRAIGTALAPSRHLAHLDVSRNAGIGNSGMEALRVAALAAVTEEAEQSQSLLPLPFPALESWDLSECEISGSEGSAALADIILGAGATAREKRRKRIRLVLNSNSIGPEGCVPLSSLLTDGSVGGGVGVGGGRFEGGGSTLSSLVMSKCAIGDGGVEALVGEHSSSGGVYYGVTNLDFTENSIEVAGARRLGESLTSSPTCRWPDLTDLILAKNDLGSEGVGCIAAALATTTALRTLDLSKTNCGTDGAIAVLNACKASSSSKTLASLRLFDNNLGSDGFRAVATVLRGGHPSLEHIDLGGNRADEDAVVALLDAVADRREGESWSKLATLEIGGNTFGEKSAEALRKLKEVWPEFDVAHDKPNADDDAREEGLVEMYNNEGKIEN